MSQDKVNALVSAVNAGDAHALQSSLSPELATAIGAAVEHNRKAAPDIRYTVNGALENGDQVAFTYTATAKAGSWHGSALATVADGKIVNLHVDEDHIGKAIALKDKDILAAAAPPSATGTWIGISSGFTITLVLVQSGINITGTATISGFTGTYPVTGTNIYPTTPNITIHANVSGLQTTFTGNFNGNNQVVGTLVIVGFSPISVTVNRQ